MATSTGSITLDLSLQLSTPAGGPVEIGEATIEVPMHTEATRTGAKITIAQDVLRHEIAAALIDAARQIEAQD